MNYIVAFNHKNASPAKFASKDDYVTEATPSFAWAVGKPVPVVIAWIERKNLWWEVTGTGVTLHGR